MPRQARLDFPGTLHHVIWRGIEKKDIISDDKDINPPNKDMSILHGALQLLDPKEIRGFRHPIDFFFRSLAEDQGERAICIVLSGTGTEGTLGLRAVKGEGGLVIV
jgi:two-component system, chemotaxis family, CheB/CheR fusion protein